MTRARAAAHGGLATPSVPPKERRKRKPAAKTTPQGTQATTKQTAQKGNRKNGNGGKHGKRRGRRSAKEPNEEGHQEDRPSITQVGNGKLNLSAQGNLTKTNPERSMTNVAYDLNHAVQFDLVLGFHLELLVYSRIMFKQLTSVKNMHELKPEDIQAWVNREIQKDLDSYFKGGYIDIQKPMFEGTQDFRYEGWYFKLPDGAIGQDPAHKQKGVAGRKGYNYYTYFSHEPSGIAAEVLQRPVVERSHVYFKTTAGPVREVHIKEETPGRYDFTQILVEHNDSVCGIRSRRIAQCLREKNKIDKDVGKCLYF